jgi:hypothetical protein
MLRGFSDFLMVSSFFYSNSFSGSFLKTGGFACNWPLARAKIACDWQPIAFKLYPSGRQSHAT